MRRLTRGLLGLLVLMTVAPVSALPQSRSDLKRRQVGFRLFAGSEEVLAVNRVRCGVRSTGEVCTFIRDFTGALWPKGTANGYIFNSGLQIAGIVGGTTADNPWAGDTSGALFYDPSTDVADGEQVQPVYNAVDPADLADWPAAALVPLGDPTEAYFNPLLRGTPSASQGDVWSLSWDGNPERVGQFGNSRPHPFGVLLEERGMAWNGPSGNEDIVYFIFTIYNITSTRPADYAGVRPAMREIVLQKARDFQVRNNAFYGVTLPERGYPMTDVFLAFGVDMDVGEPSRNYSSVNLPFEMGYTYMPDFPTNPTPDGPIWTFDPSIFSPPFFAGVGLAGVKYLRGPVDSLGQPVGLRVFGNATNGGVEGGLVFNDPSNMAQAYRYLAGEPDPGEGDNLCNTGDPKLTHICFINNALATDVRFFQSSGPFTLPPGGSQSVAVAYIFAAPVAAVDCTVGCEVKPGDPTILGDAARMTDSVNTIDKVTGYEGFTDANADGHVEQDEFRVVPGSLLGKALVAQAVFDGGFLVPFGPKPPEFFLVPGNNQVTVLWRPSATETEGDPFFAQATAPTVNPPGGGAPMPNPQYDPNYRQYDLEGYRVYRGRVDNPTQLHLVAQFDHRGTFIRDYTGQVNPVPGCAPELGIDRDCPVPFDSLVPGVPPTTFVDVPLVGDVVQVRRGERSALATGEALATHADTAITGTESGCLLSGTAELCRLRDSGVPFVFVDHGVRNDFRYFYAVTAFDVNSYSSVQSTLESPRTTQPVTPVSPASNYESSATVTFALSGRGLALDTAAQQPTLNRENGRFSAPAPPGNAFAFDVAELVREVLDGPVSVSLTLDSVRLGSAYEHGVGEVGEPATWFLGTKAGGGKVEVEVPVTQDQTQVSQANFAYFEAATLDQDLTSRFGGGAGFALTGRLELQLPGNYYTSAWGRGCINLAPGFAAPETTGCEYNGARWFEGPSPQRNETRDHPQASHPANASLPGPMADLNNAGELPGVATIHMPHAYETAESGYRVIEGVLGAAQRAADFNVFWGPGGSIDSVIDVTHNVPVPFDSLQLAGTWGILNQQAASGEGAFDQRPGVLTTMDFTCVDPLRTWSAVQDAYPCTAPPYRLSRTAAPGPVAIWDQTATNARTVGVRPGTGFALYLAGNVTIFELAGSLPEAGTVWTLRTYVGAISGGRGAAGDRGPYVFAAQPRPLTAVGVELRLDYDVVNHVAAVSKGDLSRVHTVPDPYYVMSTYEVSTDNKVLKFVNLPEQAIIRIYSASGVLVDLLEHRSNTYGGSADWDLRNRNEQVVASGVYFYHIESGDARRVGRFTVVNFAK